MANLKIPMEGKIEIELSEEAKDILMRFISAVERLEDRDASKKIYNRNQQNSYSESV